MKIKNSLYGIIISVLLSLLALFSCDKENPVEPPPPISNDTGSKYNWELKNIHSFNFVTGLYVADTNEIYIQAGFNYVIYYNGVSGEYFDFNHPEFTCKRVNGYDKNNVYFGGAVRLSSQKNVPTVKKKTNGIISTYILDTINSAIHDIIVISENTAWLSDTKNLYHFDNGNSKKYQISNNDSLLIFKIYYDNSGFYAFVINFDDEIIYTYKFVNDNFILIREDCGIPSNPNCVYPYMAICGNDIISFHGSHNLLKKFENDIWSVHSLLDSLSIEPSQIAGYDKDSLIALCYSYNYGGFQLYFYNGQKWRCENIFPLVPSGSSNNFCYEGKVKNGNVYFLYIYDVTGRIYLLVGRPKK